MCDHSPHKAQINNADDKVSEFGQECEREYDERNLLLAGYRNTLHTSHRVINHRL
jgi:hypothetical protein